MEPWMLWILVAVACVVLEVVSVQIVMAYFGIGALAAAGAAALDTSTVVQIAVFALVSLILLFLTRPVVMRRMQPASVPSSVHALTGKRGIVTIAIDNDANAGQIRVGTEHWTARTPNEGEVVPVDSRVEVLEINGVTALVKVVAPASTTTASAADDAVEKADSDTGNRGDQPQNWRA